MMTLNNDSQSIYCLNEDSKIKIIFAIQLALYEIFNKCDWSISIEDTFFYIKGVVYYQIKVEASRVYALDVAKNTRKRKKLKFNITGENLTLGDIYKQSFRGVEECRK